MMHVPASQASRAPAWGLQANYRQSGASSQAQQPIRGAPYQMADRPPGWGSERDSKPHGAGVYGQAQASGPPAHLADAYSGWDGPRASQAQTAEDYRRAPANLAPPQADFWQGQDARRKLDNPSNGKAEGPPQHQGIGRAPIGLPPTAPPTISSGVESAGQSFSYQAGAGVSRHMEQSMTGQSALLFPWSPHQPQASMRRPQISEDPDPRMVPQAGVISNHLRQAGWGHAAEPSGPVSAVSSHANEGANAAHHRPEQLKDPGPDTEDNYEDATWEELDCTGELLTPDGTPWQAAGHGMDPGHDPGHELPAGHEQAGPSAGCPAGHAVSEKAQASPEQHGTGHEHDPAEGADLPQLASPVPTAASSSRIGPAAESGSALAADGGAMLSPELPEPAGQQPAPLTAPHQQHSGEAQGLAALAQHQQHPDGPAGDNQEQHRGHAANFPLHSVHDKDPGAGHLEVGEMGGHGGDRNAPAAEAPDDQLPSTSVLSMVPTNGVESSQNVFSAAETAEQAVGDEDVDIQAREPPAGTTSLGRAGQSAPGQSDRMRHELESPPRNSQPAQLKPLSDAGSSGLHHQPTEADRPEVLQQGSRPSFEDGPSGPAILPGLAGGELRQHEAGPVENMRYAADWETGSDASASQQSPEKQDSSPDGSLGH